MEVSTVPPQVSLTVPSTILRSGSQVAWHIPTAGASLKFVNALRSPAHTKLSPQLWASDGSHTGAQPPLAQYNPVAQSSVPSGIAPPLPMTQLSPRDRGPCGTHASSPCEAPLSQLVICQVHFWSTAQPRLVSGLQGNVAASGEGPTQMQAPVVGLSDSPQPAANNAPTTRAARHMRRSYPASMPRWSPFGSQLLTQPMRT